MERPDFIMLQWSGTKVYVAPHTAEAKRFLTEHGVTLPSGYDMVFPADAIASFVEDIEAAGLLYWIVSFHNPTLH